MGQRSLTIKPWLLPLIVIALAVPGSAAFVVAGPGLGLAVGALAAASVILIAVAKKPDEPIEVARAADQHRRLLLIAIDPVDRPAEVEEVRAVAHAGLGAEPEVLVLAPAFNSPLSHWASDVAGSRLDAQRRLVLTMGALAAAEVEARGAVGDPDPLQAVEDTLRDFAADEVIVAIPQGGQESDARALMAELRRRLDLPVHPLSSGSPVGGAG
ncbi:MAG: hypothetical protein ACRDKV_01120 [Solirubrobacterales bacterium]